MKDSAIEHNVKITQANAFIEGVYDMNLLELRVFLTLLAKHKKGVNVFKESVKLTQADLDMKHIDKGNFSRQLRKFTDRISDIKFKYETDLAYEPLHIFAPVMRKDTNTVEIKLSLEIQDLVNIWTKNFTEADVDTLIQIPNFTTYRIYMLLKQYQNFKSERKFTLDELREKLCLTGQKSYELYGSFKQRILEPACEYLKGTDMAFKYEPLKTGKQVTGVKFTFRKGKLKEAPEPKQIEIFASEPIQNSSYPELEVSKDEDLVKYNAINIMRGYKIPDKDIARFITELQPLVITKANKWFKTNRPTLTVTGTDGEYFATLLNNKITKPKK